MVETGVVCGRFQIFHNEHLQYVLSAKKRCRYLLVGITSPDGVPGHEEEADTNRGKRAANPCTYYERMCIIRNTLLEAGLSREEFDIIPYPIERPQFIKSYVPEKACHFITILDQWGECKKKRIEDMGFPVVVLWKYIPKNISSTMIRQAIGKNGEWRQYVPDAAYEYITSHGIDERISRLLKEESEICRIGDCRHCSAKYTH